ncbi:MAG TPA: aromatic ring-hydroxylating dioxygenase subunit alpha [Euzebyales bacterium]|nr:aromatic ring-hydroxylating dioxygenase subunit alpha [Euzebyales bacterium]
MAAPVLDASELAFSAAPHERARTLPGAAYRAPEVLVWEQRVLLAGSWLCVGRADEFAPGDRRALLAGDQPVIVTRDGQGRLHCLSNVCRHRGHEVLPVGDSTGTALRCPYHGWVYGLDGGFRGGPRLRATPGFDRTDPSHGLLELHAVEWGGFVFVSATHQPPSFADWVDGLDDLLAAYELGRLRTAISHEYEVAANWKLLVENYHECYHCDEIHPELCRVSAPLSGYDLPPRGAWRGGSMELIDGAETMSLDGHSRGVAMRRLDAARLRDVFYVGVFPNLLISAHPDYVMTHLLRPLAPDRTAVTCSWLFPPEAFAMEGFDPSYAADFWDLTNRQDWAACEGVQRGVGGLGYRQGPFSGDEATVHMFVQQIARAYMAGTVAPVVSLPDD